MGLERVAAESGGPLRRRRVGLVAHAASVTAGGRHAIDVLGAAGVHVVRVFAPEHGLRGDAAAGEVVAGGLDAASGLPVASLYGARTRPERAQLADLDALVFDLQDAGVRFYTYASTLVLCLDAAAEAGVELVVLDRPNPLGGERVEGPPSDPRDVVPESFVNMAPGTLVHGLTLGELARHANARRQRPGRLTVVPMRGWRRDMLWADTGRPWVPPSPNLLSAEAALVYPGVALLEATNVSEGRGTEAPFLLLGAPWLKTAGPDATLRDALGGPAGGVAFEPATFTPRAALGASVPGVAFEPTTFTPAASPAAPHPEHVGALCHGWRLRVTDGRGLSPYALGVRLLDALRRRPGFEWREDGAALVRLVGSRGLLDALRRGDTPERILADDQAGRAAWRRARRPSLLY